MASLANTLLGPLVDRDGVVSSPDLVPLIIKHVECNGRVPRVCSTWQKGWDQHHRGKGSMKNASCERLPAAALEQDDFFGSAGGFVSDVASVGEGLIISRGPDGQALQLVDQNMAVKSEKKMDASSLLHATDQSVLTAEPGTGAVTGWHSTALRLRSLPGFDLIREVPLEAQVDGGLSHCDTLRAGTVVDGRLICTVGTPVFDGPPGELFFLRVYDAGSLAFQRAIPLDFAPAFGALAVKGDEVRVTLPRASTSCPSATLATASLRPRRCLRASRSPCFTTAQPSPTAKSHRVPAYLARPSSAAPAMRMALRSSYWRAARSCGGGSTSGTRASRPYGASSSAGRSCSPSPPTGCTSSR